ncbi:hypothetical protein GCM10027265_25780 [Jatrophihabitans fulvus]
MRAGRPWRTRRARLALPVLGAVGAVVLASCSSSADDRAPDYRPSPPPNAIAPSPGVRISPILPVPSLSGPDENGGGGGGGQGGQGGGGSSSSGSSKQDPLVVATRLSYPVGLTLLPDNTALVGERTTGRIVRVQPRAGQPVPTVRTLPGIDAAGGGGLLDLALSPTYDQDQLIYAYISTRTDNRVVAFTLNGPVTPVLTGIPRGDGGNTGRLTVSPTGTLLLGTGDAGRASLATRQRSLAGKVLRFTDIGQPAAGNPSASSPVYASGLRRTDGLCGTADNSTLFQLETSPDGAGEVNLVRRAGNYASTPPSATTPAKAGAVGDCAVLDNTLYVTSLDGRQLLSAPVTGSSSAPRIGKFTATLTNRYGRLRTVVAAADGALWLTTSNKDGKGKPVPADERVIRYVPQGGGGGSTA